jgi:hypothetical protein
MSLKFFHIVFISLSTLLALGVTVWAIEQWRDTGGASSLALAAVALGGGGVLVVYGNRFLQKTRALGLAVLIAATLGAPADVLACAVCMGNTHSSLRDGMNMGILVLVGITLFMLASFASFFVYLARKARAAARSQEREPAHA